MLKGKPKKVHLMPIVGRVVERVKAQVAKWKGSLLSYMGRVLLVKPVIYSMLFYSFQIHR